MELAPPRGTADLLPPRAGSMLALYEAAHGIARLHGFRYVETPVFEQTDLFARSSGESSDVVTKEMYTFEDQGGRSLTLRPEQTAPIVRAYLRHAQELAKPFKGYYVGSQFRHGRPQAGRLREFRQFGIETLGVAAASADVETIVIGQRFLSDRGLTSLTLRVNSIGDENCRPDYRKKLVAYLEPHEAELCKDCRSRLRTNPLRVFDCKEDGQKPVVLEAPTITDHLCSDCEEHFSDLKAGLAAAGIAYDVDPRLVRGLDYYTRTAFEFDSSVLSPAQATVCGGGRYDGLAQALGGEATPGVGFALGLDRTLLAMEGEEIDLPKSDEADCFIVAIGTAARESAARLAETMRGEGIAVDLALEERPLKAQLKMADRSGASFVAILGERELEEGTVTLRRLADGEQRTVAVDRILEEFSGGWGA